MKEKKRQGRLNEHLFIAAIRPKCIWIITDTNRPSPSWGLGLLVDLVVCTSHHWSWSFSSVFFFHLIISNTVSIHQIYTHRFNTQRLTTGHETHECIHFPQFKERKITIRNTIIRQSFYGFLCAQILAYFQLPVNDVRGRFYIAPSPTDQFYVLVTQSAGEHWTLNTHAHTHTLNQYISMHRMSKRQCVQLAMNKPNKMVNKNRADDSDTRTQRGRVNCFYCTVYYFGFFVVVVVIVGEDQWNEHTSQMNAIVWIIIIRFNASDIRTFSFLAFILT